MILSAKDILEEILSKKLTKDEAVLLLTSLVENSDDIDECVEYLEVFEKLSPKSRRSFKFLESILMSDNYDMLRCVACKALLRHFPKKTIPALKWIITICRTHFYLRHF